jgi:hypothetical protein
MRKNRSEQKIHTWLSIEKKKESVDTVQKGSTITSVAQEYGVPRSTVATFWQQREKIMSARVSVGAMKISDKNRSSINEEIEKLLITWIKERQMKGDPVTQAMICENARLIFEELQKKTPGSTSNKTEEFKARRGWFHRFKGRTGIHSVLRHGEVATADKDAAENL